MNRVQVNVLFTLFLFVMATGAAVDVLNDHTGFIPKQVVALTTSLEILGLGVAGFGLILAVVSIVFWLDVVKK